MLFRSKPRQLAPTVGPAAALAGVFIRTGSIIASGERVLCGLAQQFGTLCFVDDNAGCFGSRPFPANGTVLSFGELQIFVATELPREYLAKVLVAEDPPSVCAVRGQRNARLATCAEVLVVAPVVGAGGAGVDAGADAEAHAEDGDEDDGLERHPRGSRFPLERVVPNEGGPGQFAAPDSMPMVVYQVGLS